MSKPQSPQLDRGFTLIEIVVVTGLISMLLITVSNMFMATITSNIRTSARQQIKEEGSYALGQIEFMLKNSAKLEENSLVQICQTGMNQIKFLSPDGFTTELKLEGTQIASNSAFLNSSLIVASNLNFDCARNPGGEYYVDISFSLAKANTTAIENFQPITESFNHMVLLRN
ncbi:MAG: type II secretion system protein [Patescibacteria group bacterium]|nr:type II secretion system GspH family protein [Patescibacteria group bacterium]